MDWFTHGDFSSTPVDYRLVLLALLLSFVSGHVIAWVYMFTHSGLSYSRSFVNSLIIMPVLVALVLMVLSNNVVTAFGLMAVLAIVRFRNVLRDTLDTTFVLSAIAVGIANGTQRFATAIVGTIAIALIMVYLSWTTFGSRNRYGMIVNIHWESGPEGLEDLGRLLARHCYMVKCASQRTSPTGKGIDFSYRLSLRDPAKSELMLGEVREFPGVIRATGVVAADESEV